MQEEDSRRSLDGDNPQEMLVKRSDSCPEMGNRNRSGVDTKGSCRAQDFLGRVSSNEDSEELISTATPSDSGIETGSDDRSSTPSGEATQGSLEFGPGRLSFLSRLRRLSASSKMLIKDAFRPNASTKRQVVVGEARCISKMQKKRDSDSAKPETAESKSSSSSSRRFLRSQHRIASSHVAAGRCSTPAVEVYGPRRRGRSVDAIPSAFARKSTGNYFPPATGNGEDRQYDSLPSLSEAGGGKEHVRLRRPISRNREGSLPGRNMSVECRRPIGKLSSDSRRTASVRSGLTRDRVHPSASRSSLPRVNSHIKLGERVEVDAPVRPRRRESAVPRVEHTEIQKMGGPRIGLGTVFRYRGARVVLKKHLSAKAHCQFQVWEAELLDDIWSPEDLKGGAGESTDDEEYRSIAEPLEDMSDSPGQTCSGVDPITPWVRAGSKLAIKFVELQPPVNVDGVTAAAASSRMKYKIQSLTAEGEQLQRFAGEMKRLRTAYSELQSRDSIRRKEEVKENGLMARAALAGVRKTPVPDYFWTEKCDVLRPGTSTADAEGQVLTVAMESIQGRPLTQLLPQLGVPNKWSTGLLCLEIAARIAEAQRVLSDCMEVPLVNWDTKPGNILLEFSRSLTSGRLHCRRAVIIDLGDALPGPSYMFSTKQRKPAAGNIEVRPSSRKGDSDKQQEGPGEATERFLAHESNTDPTGYIICTKGFCAPECAVLVFLLASNPRCSAFRRIWYGKEADLPRGMDRMATSRRFRINHVWRGLIKEGYLRPVDPIPRALRCGGPEMNFGIAPTISTGPTTSTMSTCPSTPSARRVESISQSVVNAASDFDLSNQWHWEVQFSQATVVFSTGLILAQLFGGKSIIHLVDREETSSVDCLCEWQNSIPPPSPGSRGPPTESPFPADRSLISLLDGDPCGGITKQLQCSLMEEDAFGAHGMSRNSYSSRFNPCPDDLLPQTGIFSVDPWRSRVRGILQGCLAFLPSQRWTFAQLESNLRLFLTEFHQSYSHAKEILQQHHISAVHQHASGGGEDIAVRPELQTNGAGFGRQLSSKEDAKLCRPGIPTKASHDSGKPWSGSRKNSEWRPSQTEGQRHHSSRTSDLGAGCRNGGGKRVVFANRVDSHLDFYGANKLDDAAAAGERVLHMTSQKRRPSQRAVKASESRNSRHPAYQCK